MDGRTKKWSFYLLAGATAAFLLWVSFRGVQWPAFADAIARCSWGFVLLSMLCGVVAFWLRGMRWRALIQPIDPSVPRMTCFNAINISYLANLLLPRVGEIVRCGYVTAESSKDDEGQRKASFDKVLGTVVLERGWDMMSMFLLLGALLAFKWKQFGDFFVVQMWEPLAASVDFSLWVIAVPALVLCIAAIVLVFAYRDRVKVFGMISGFFAGMLKGFASCLKMERKWLFFVQTALIWFMYWCMSFFTMKALASNPLVAPLGASDALFLMMAGSLSSLVPVPGGFGAFHFIVKAAITGIYGIPGAMALVFATLSHESQAITQAACGMFSFIWESIRRHKE
ncbi:MAG: flippase-like domain-containing protein [Bacteroidales bacterium]|nr:flippase-like domain-containing protein [Bacteroidales bacterium]